MNKIKFALLTAGISLALAFTFSCSSDDGDGGGGVVPSSNSWQRSSSSSGSGSVAYTLTCAVVPSTGIESATITQPTVTCNDIAVSSGLNWTNAPNWNNPAIGTYNGMSVSASFGNCSGKSATCSGTLTVGSAPEADQLTCTGMPTSGAVGTAIKQPTVRCGINIVTTGIIWANAPAWADPEADTYSVTVTANCGGSSKTASCGTLTVSSSSVQSSSSSVIVSSSSSEQSSSSAYLIPPISSSSVQIFECELYNDKTQYCSNGTVKNYGYMTYGGNTYKTVVIGTQTWMAENLTNYTTWDNAMSKDFCPKGWHIPSNGEWNTLISFVGGSSAAYRDLRATSWGGTNKYGFSALPLGWYGTTGDLLGGGKSSIWASAGNMGGFAMESGNIWWNQLLSHYQISARCVQDDGVQDSSITYTLTCANIPATGTVGTAITAPAVTCSGSNNTSTSVNSGLIWTGAPNWSNLVAGTYSGISVSASSGNCSGKTANCSGTLTVGVPGKGNDIAKYRTTKIGEQVWMAEDLDYYVSGSKCYDDRETNCAIYGRLYDWTTAMNLLGCNYVSCASQIGTNHRGICPSGWHIPNNDDWNALMKFVNPSCSDNSNCSDAGTKLKSTSGWDSYDGVPTGTDNYGFSALPRDNTFGSWWSASESGARTADFRSMGYNYADVCSFDRSKTDFISVRCVQD